MSARRSSSTTILHAEDLGYRLTSRWLWRGLALNIASGQQIALRGLSGSGKTVLLRVLAGLEDAAEGAVYLHDKPLTDWAVPDYRSQVMYLHQRPVALADTVADSLEYPFTLRVHRERRYRPERVRVYLQRLDREPAFLDQACATLSGGEHQLLALLRALQLDPQILLLDEATASLDPTTTRRVETLVAEWLAEQTGRACVWTSHDPAQLRRVADAEWNLSAAADD